MTVPSLGLVILAVDDLPRSSAFYRAILGWTATVDVPVYLELAGPDGIRLGLYRADGFATNVGQTPVATPPTAITRAELYLRCDDPETSLARAVTAGARLLSPVALRDWGDHAGYVADPDGNVVAFARPGS